MSEISIIVIATTIIGLIICFAADFVINRDGRDSEGADIVKICVVGIILAIAAIRLTPELILAAFAVVILKIIITATTKRFMKVAK